MDLKVNEFVDNLLSVEAHERPSDNVKVEDLDMEMRLPEWFDKEKYNKGRDFFWRYRFAFVMNMVFGLIAVLAVPSILKILVSTRRSNSMYTSYKRYVSTLMHIISWYQYELKPGTKSWRSLYAVRQRHLRAGKQASLQGLGTISQRDLALTQFGFIGFAVLRPEKSNIRQQKDGDWEGFNHFWRTVGYMLGLEDRYNICRSNIDETREACRLIQERVFTPCLENVPEYFEHTSRVMIEGLGAANPMFETGSLLFWTRYLAGVPGYVYTEDDRIVLQKKLKEQLNGKSGDIGVDATSLICKSAVEGLPNRPPHMLFLREYDCLETTPGYRRMNFKGKYKIAMMNIVVAALDTAIGRAIMNFFFTWSLFITFNFPFKAFIKFGIKESYVDMFVEDPKDDEVPKPNEEYYKPLPPDTWYSKVWTVLW